MQSCFSSVRAFAWIQSPQLLDFETTTAEPPQKVYSWDNKPTDNSEYLIENLNDQTVIKAPGEISGNQFMVRNCQNCCIYLFDHINTITVDDCKQCKIFIGPTKGSLFLRDSSECTLVAACGQFRTRDARQITIFLSCSTTNN